MARQSSRSSASPDKEKAYQYSLVTHWLSFNSEPPLPVPRAADFRQPRIIRKSAGHSPRKQGVGCGGVWSGSAQPKGLGQTGWTAALITQSPLVKRGTLCPSATNSQGL